MHDFLDRRCEKLSTGMKQKTSIARTLVHDPQVMIFDEPTLGPRRDGGPRRSSSSSGTAAAAARP